ncbi:hypothetical protein [Herbaspirillum seropedicae]|uniref:hypothetical protein n=1 Tax=Herbaspirillum seropedicae TaxID=964 RepID=UPI003D987560
MNNNFSLKVPAVFAHAVFLAGAPLASPASAAVNDAVQVSYQSRQSNGTLGNLQRRGAAYEVQQVDQFQQKLVDFYIGLASRQQSLPASVATALYDNTWDLYAR